MFKTEFKDISSAVNFTFTFIMVISVALMVLITVLMIYFVIRYRRSKNPVPAQVHSHTLLEITWTVIPTLLVLVMFYYGWIGFKLMRTPPEDSMQVQATARMWSWSFEYENGKQSTELYVPAGQPIQVNLESLDVLHSFYVPAFMVKFDVVPGMDNYVWFNAVDTGTYDILCAEYCGQRHSYMMSKVISMPPAEFDVWVTTDVDPMAELEAGDASAEERAEQLALVGKRLYTTKGCVACHTIDGTKLVGPSHKGVFGKSERVVTDGETREIVVDEAYIRRSLLDPNADLVEGFQPLMPSQQGIVTDEEIDALIAYMKTL